MSVTATAEHKPSIMNNVAQTNVPRPELVANHRDFHWITEKICAPMEGPALTWWKASFLISSFVAIFTFIGLTYLVATGVGVWGLRSPINWGWAIVNFVFWIGIGHAGTLISAILCLLKQKWRTSINRPAEAMTIFAVMCAGLFPLFHVGRVWFSWWLFPIPLANRVWPNFRSPLEWDVFAVSTYFTVSILFWYMGMIPDLATVRDRATTLHTRRRWRKYFYGILAMGWRGSGRHWSNYEMAYLMLAGLSTPLVLSVHTVVSFDFAVALVPGWHTTIFPPYFVAGAIFSGFAMVLTLMLPIRAICGLHDLITIHHIGNMCKITLATGSMVGFGYAMEFFISYYSASPIESFTFINRAIGQYGWAYVIMVSCNVIIPQLFWFKKIRHNLMLVWIICVLVNVGMWFERFVIVVTSLANDYLPSSWGYYSPTIVDIFTFVGTFGFFSMMFLLFVRYLPMMAIGEMKAVTPQGDPHHPDHKESD